MESIKSLFNFVGKSWAILGIAATISVGIYLAAPPAALTDFASNITSAGPTNNLLETVFQAIWYNLAYVGYAVPNAVPFLEQVADAGLWGLEQVGDGAKYVMDSFDGADEYGLLHP